MTPRPAQNKANPDAPDVTDEQAESPPADHAADPPPADAAGAATPGGDTTADIGGTTLTAAGGEVAGGEVRGGRLADLGGTPAVMPEGVGYAIAREPLYISNPEAAAAPVRAFNPGDRVPAELVEKFGWGDLTDLPEWATAPPAPAPDSEGAE
jgi:hypothetical protein